MELIHYNWMPRIADWGIDINPLFYYSQFGIRPPIQRPFPDWRRIKSGDIIFVKTDFIQNGSFVNDYMPLIKVPVILISGISSFNNLGYEQILNNSYIHHWFATNPPTTHNKLSGIPIGFEETDRIGGNQNLISSIRVESSNNTKINKIYVPYHTLEHNKERKDLINYFKQFAYIDVESDFLSFENYLSKLSNYQYSICLPGTGHDTHRVYESLCVKTVPICIESPVRQILTNWKVPSIFLNNWKEDLGCLLNKISYNWDNLESFLSVKSHIQLILESSQKIKS